MQSPRMRPVTVITLVPLTLQMPGVRLLKVTGSPELAVAFTTPLPPIPILGRAPMVITWLPFATIRIQNRLRGSIKGRVAGLIGGDPANAGRCMNDPLRD